MQHQSSSPERKAPEDGRYQHVSTPFLPGNDEFPEDPAKKRPRVTFNQTIQTREVSANDAPKNTPDKAMGIIQENVRRAIYRHRDPNATSSGSELYDQLKEVFTADPKKADNSLYSYDVPDPTTLKYHLRALHSQVAFLDRNCSSLVHAVIGSEWLGRDEAYVKDFTRFLGCCLPTLLESHEGQQIYPDTPPVPASEYYARAHMAVRHIIGKVPAGSGSLSPVLSQNFPYETESAKSYVAYTRNLIKIISYAPELQSEILALITDKLVKIDVQIQVDLEDFEDEFGETLLNQAPLDADEEADDDSDISDDEDDEELRVQGIKENIHKVDGMLDILFEFYSHPFETGSLVDKENTLLLLLSHFRAIILPTYRSRHPQFLLFHFSQFSPKLIDLFVEECMKIIQSKLQSSIMRQSAAAYLASFVARGAHIPGETVRSVFDMLLACLDRSRADYEASCRGPDLRRYGPFYAVSQALLYIFCFRWRDLTVAAIEGDTMDQIDDLAPEQVSFPPHIKDSMLGAIKSKLNPLKICTPGIVTEFARISHHFNLLYAYTIIETNKRLRISTFRSLSSFGNPNYAQVEREVRAGDHLGYQLDAYFPFDPYQLPRSRRWLEGDYVEWRGIPGLNNDDDDDDDSGVDDEDDDDEDDDEEATATDEE
ncbi:hypothetical protein N7470_001987 [Penicillium chermesinum]|nr:hypothetical protein N7470_001987 [Penicillium chermesinum]